MAAGLLTSLVGALLVTVLGMGTTAVMLKAAWLRNWLYHGQHLWYGVQNLSADLRTLPAIAYSHELTGSVDADVLNAIIIFFPLIALVPTVCVAISRTGDAAAGRGDPQRGGGGPPGPGPAPEPLHGRPAGRNPARPVEYHLAQSLAELADARLSGAGDLTSSWPSRVAVAAATASTAWPNASALCPAGARKPLIFRTYCSAAARMSSSVTCSA